MLESFLNRHISEVINAAFDGYYDSDDKIARRAFEIVLGDKESVYEDVGDRVDNFMPSDFYDYIEVLYKSNDYIVRRSFYKFLQNRNCLALIAKAYATAVYENLALSKTKIVAVSCGCIKVFGYSDYWRSRKIATSNGIVHRDFVNQSQLLFKDDPGLKLPLHPFLNKEEEEKVFFALKDAHLVGFDIEHNRDKDGNLMYRLYHVVCKADSGKTLIISIPVTEVGYDPLNGSIGEIVQSHCVSEEDW